MKKNSKIFFSMALSLFLIGGSSYAQESEQAIKVGGSIRVRPDVKQNVGFVENIANSHHYVGQKTQLFAEKNFGKVIGKIMLQDSRIWGQNSDLAVLDTAAEKQATDIREAYFRFACLLFEDHFITIGRQILAYGDQRLVGSLDWTNIGRSFDGIKFEFIKAQNKLDVFSTIVSEKKASDVGQTFTNANGDVVFNGIYNSLSLFKPLIIDAYYLSQLNVDDSSTLKLHTVGARLNLKPQDNGDGLDFTIEGAYQAGKKNTLNIAAYAAAVQLGYTMTAGLKMRFSAEVDYASGDTDSSDNKYQTFSNLYHTNHMHYGQADLMSWQNALVGLAKAQVFFSKGHDITLAYVYGARATEKDSWYNVAGSGTLNAYITDETSQVSSKKHLFHEIDLTYNLPLYEQLSVHAGGSAVLRGEALKDAKKPSDYLYLFCMVTTKI